MATRSTVSAKHQPTEVIFIMLYFQRLQRLLLHYLLLSHFVSEKSGGSLLYLVDAIEHEWAVVVNTGRPPAIIHHSAPVAAQFPTGHHTGHVPEAFHALHTTSHALPTEAVTLALTVHQELTAAHTGLRSTSWAHSMLPKFYAETLQYCRLQANALQDCLDTAKPFLSTDKAYKRPDAAKHLVADWFDMHLSSTA